jgi:hypothetical protein
MPPRKAELDEEIQRLYRLPLEELIPARNALAARLRKEKRTDDAAEVRSLVKPTPSAWAVNALFEREPAKMEALLAAGKRARAAQREAVSGRGAEALREAIRAARGLSDELRWEAGQILAEQGRPPSRTMVERIAANLQALAFSPAAAEEAARGWLDRDLEPPGFEVLAGLQVAGAPVVDLAARREARRKEEERKKESPKPVPPPPPKVVARPERTAREAKRQEEGRRQQERREEARRRQEAAERSRREREEEQLRRRRAVAQEKVEQARAEADSLREEAERTEKEAADLRRQAETAERAAARAGERAEKASERLAAAEEALRAIPSVP